MVLFRFTFFIFLYISYNKINKKNKINNLNLYNIRYHIKTMRPALSFYNYDHYDIATGDIIEHIKLYTHVKTPYIKFRPPVPRDIIRQIRTILKKHKTGQDVEKLLEPHLKQINIFLNFHLFIYARRKINNKKYILSNGGFCRQSITYLYGYMTSQEKERLYAPILNIMSEIDWFFDKYYDENYKNYHSLNHLHYISIRYDKKNDIISIEESAIRDDIEE